MLSFIIPAHNEEALLAQTLSTLHESAAALGTEYELILVDDASTDRTAEIGRSLADRVVSVSLRQIAGTRNAGARAALGDVFIFVDADTLVPVRTLQQMMRALKRGAIGGGAWADADSLTPLWGRFAMKVMSLFYCGLAGNAAGCFLYARRADFEAVGGFDDRLYASEEVHLSAALKRRGHFFIIRAPVITSGRKLRMLTVKRIVRQYGQLIRFGKKAFEQREAMDVWYGEGLRETPSSRG